MRGSVILQSPSLFRPGTRRARVASDTGKISPNPRVSPIKRGEDSGLVEPNRIQPHDVKYAEIVMGGMPLHVIVPDIIDFLPADRQEGRILFHHRLGLADQLAARFCVDL